MSEAQIPRGAGPGLGPNAVPAVSWFEFVLEENKLEEHLSKENAEPSASQLIIQFMQQVEAEIALNTQSLREANPPIIPQERTENGVEKPAEDSRKIRDLRILALKVFAYLYWDLTFLEKSVPTPIIQAVMIEFLRIAAPHIVDSIHSPDLEDTHMSDSALFAVHLFHRWCVRSVVRDNFPSRPIKTSFMSVQQDPNAVNAITEAILRKFREQLPQSVSFLEKCCEDQLPTRMPTAASFRFPRSSLVPVIDWEKTVQVPSEEVVCVIAFDLGSMYFYERDYRKAFEKFRTCRQILNQLDKPVYCKINQDRLRGYLTSCSSLLGVAIDTPSSSLFDRAEATRKKDCQGIVAIFQEDNLKQELTMAYRSSVQDELAKRGLHQLHIQVCLCNIVRTVVEGKAVVSPILEALSSADEEVHKFLVQILSDMMKGASQAQRSNLKCFTWHLIELLPPESTFSRLVASSDMAAYFTEAEMAEMAVEDVDNDQLYLEDLGMDMATVSTSFPSTRESSYNVSDVEGQLLAVYEPVVIRDLLTDLYENRGLHPSQIIALNDKWKVPKEIRQALEYLPDAEFKQAYAFVLIAKARHCMDLSLFERARQLLMEAESVVKDISYLLSKHLQWQILLADLLQYYKSETPAQAASVQELVKKTKTCLTSVRLAQDLQPSSEVLEQCTAFLLNVRDWDYLSSLQNTGSSYMELSRILANVCKELPNVANARKSAREFWEVVLGIYQNPNNKRNTAGPTGQAQSAKREGVQREGPTGILAQDAFYNYVQRIKEPTLVSLLISCFAKLFAILKADITNEISTEFVSIWPTTVGSANLINISGVEDTLKILMTHALKVNPTNPSWLRSKADIYFAEGHYSTAMKFYLEAGVVATDFFSIEVTRNIYDDTVYHRMIKCCSALQCHTQVAVLCQFLEETDYSCAFKALQERNVYDAMDAYYCCIWDVTMLEHLVHLHGRKGELDKRQCALRALSQMDINASNPEEIRRRAKHIRKTKFLRALAKQYIV